MNSSIETEGTRDKLEIRYNGSAMSFRIALYILSCLFVTLGVINRFDKLSTLDLMFASVFLTVGVAVTIFHIAQARRATVIASLKTDGIRHQNGQFYGWEHFEEISIGSNTIAFRRPNEFFPWLSLHETYVGDEQMHVAKEFVRSHAPSKINRAF